MAVGLGAEVFVLDVDLERLRYLDDIFGSSITTLMSHAQNIENAVTNADLVVGGVLIAGAKAPHLVNREMLSRMKKGCVIVDVAVDQGGCIETIKPTFHDNPTYVVDDVIHYGVANMPGAVARTSTFALTNATLPYALKIANMGWKEAVRQDKSLLKGLNVIEGTLVCDPVGEATGIACTPVEAAVGF
jgi:alanine dehydrogenase